MRRRKFVTLVGGAAAMLPIAALAQVAPSHAGQLTIVYRELSDEVSEGVMATPVTRYAKSGDVHVAYQVFGSGSIDLVWSDRCGASPPAFLTRRAIARRYGVSASTAARIVISQGFPAPTVINGQPYWRLSEIEAHEESRRRVRVVS